MEIINSTTIKTFLQASSIFAMFLFLQSCNSFFEAEPENNPEAIFEDLWNTYNEEYAVFEERNIDWNDLYEGFRPSVTAGTSDDELFAIISQMLAYLDDGHVSLTAPGKEVFFSNKIRRQKIDDDLFNTEVIKTHYLEPGYKTGDEESYIYGKIKNENIGYMYFEHVGTNFFNLHDFLDDYASADGYIIDLRHNDGGDFTYCFSEIGRLVDQERFVFRSKTKNGKGPDDFTPWHDWSIKPEGTHINKPIIVLTDRYTISAGERAVMAFDVLPNVTIVGDTTNGAQGTMIARELANGWFYSLVTQKVQLEDGNSYEGIGIAPDIFKKNTPGEINAGIDAVLQFSIEELQ